MPVLPPTSEPLRDRVRRFRVASALGLFVMVLLCGSTATAQLPIPELEDAPDLRLASADAYRDRLSSARQRIQRSAADREPDMTGLRESLERQLEIAATGTRPRRFDPEAARRLIDSLQRETQLRQEAVDIIKRAEQWLDETPPEPPETATLDEVALAAQEVRRHEATVKRQQQLAKRLRSFGARAPSPLENEDATAQRAIRQQFQLQQAQADIAEAQSLRAEGLARRQRQRVGALTAAWTPTSERIEEAEQQVAAAAATAAKEARDIARTRSKTATVARIRSGESEVEHAARQSQLNAELATLGYRETQADARITRARARLAAMRQRAGLGTAEADLSSSALTLRVLGVEQAASRLDARLAQLKVGQGTWRVRRAVTKERTALERSLAALRYARQDLSRALIYTEIREGRIEPPTTSTRSRQLRLALSMLLLLAAVFVLTRGYRWGNHLLKYQEVLPEDLRLSDRVQARLRTLAVLLWPVIIAAAAAALLIWPIWGLSLSVGEALQLVDRPVFFVDETGVSILSVVKLAFAIYAATVLSSALREFLQSRVYPQTDWDIGLTTALDTLVHYLTMTIGLVVGLRFVGVGFSALAILAGLLGIGIGFGLRNIAENFISGLIILAERPIKIGDFIELGPGDVEGQVRRIRARSTTVVTRDNISIIIPNSEFVAGRVTNWSHSDPKVRLAIHVGVVYGSDTDLVRKALLEVADRHGKVLNRPAPEVEFRAFGASSLDFILRAWIDQQVDRFRIASDLRFAVDSTFRRYNIEIAFPQLDLHLKSTHGPLLEAVAARSGPAAQQTSAPPSKPQE